MNLNIFSNYTTRAATVFLISAYLFLPFSLAAHNAGMGLAVVLALLSGCFWKQFHLIKKEPLAWVIAIFFLLISFATLYSLSNWGSELGTTFNKYSKILYGLILICLLIDKKTRIFCFYAFAAGSVFVLVSTYLNSWFELPWASKKWKDSTVFGSYITQSIMMSFFTLQCLFWSSEQRSFGKKIIGWILSILAAISILYLSDGRTGYLTLGLGILAYTFFALPKKWAAIGVMGLILAGSAAFATSERIQGRYELAKIETEQLFDQYQQGVVPELTSIGARWFMWMKSAELIAERPFTGWGLGSHGIKWCEKAPQPEWCAVGDTTPHNQFLFFGVEMGVLGIAFFIALFAVLIWAALQGGVYRPLMMGFIAIFFADSMVNASLWNSREYNFFILLMCLLYSMVRFKEKNGSTHND